jgi:hypothetical protein
MLEQMEEIIDIQGLGGAIDLIAQVCYEKAAHHEAEWQDERTARLWTKAAVKIERFATKFYTIKEPKEGLV